MTGIAEEIAIILSLIVLNGFFSGSEAALLAVRPSRIKELVKRGRPGARTLERFKKSPESFLSTVQVGVTLVGTLASVVSGAHVVAFLIPWLKSLPWLFVRNSAEPLAIALVVIAVSFLSLIIGELVPKYYALSRPGTVALRAARPVRIISIIAFPVIKIITLISTLIARMLGVRRGEIAGSAVTDEELKLMALEGSRNGNIDQTERRLVHAALGFTHIISRNIMTARTEMTTIDINWDVSRSLQIIIDNGYSRYPVYRQDQDKIIGILYTKDVIKQLAAGRPKQFDNLLREPYFVPDSMPIGMLLAKFQSKRTHLAVVLDEFGGTAGIITLEDILEELVGEIRDEHDEETREFVRRSQHRAVVAGTLSVEDLNDYFEAELPTDSAGTVGGLITDELNRIPRAGDHATFGPITLRVLRADSRRVLSLDVTRVVPDEEE